MDLATIALKVETADLKKTGDLLEGLATKSETVEKRFDSLGESFVDVYKRSNFAANVNLQVNLNLI